MNRTLALLSSVLTGLVVSGFVALAAPPGVINQFNAVCDPAFPQNCASVAADGTLKVTTGSGSLFTGTDDAGLTNLAKTWAFMAGYDGVTEDLIRSGDVNNVAAATGYLDALAIGRYNATLPAIADTRFNALQVGQRGSLHTELYAPDSLTALSVQATNTDTLGVTASLTHLGINAISRIWNGTNFSRLLEVANGLNSIGTGIPTAGQVGQCDDTSPVAITENQFGNARINCIDHSQIVSGKTTIADGIVLGDTVKTFSAMGVTDGSNMWQVRQALNGLNTSGPGLLPAQVVGQCDDTTPVITNENQFANIRLNCNTHALLTQPLVATGGGVATTYLLEPTASDNHANIKTSAGNVYWWSAFNNSATINYIRLYDAAAGFNGCSGSSGIKWEGMIPASTSGAGFVMNFNTPLSFATGIAICVTGGFGQTNVTAATASAISITVGYN